MRKIFIDCGSNVGQSIDFFKKTFINASNFIIYCFEPLPQFNRMYKNRMDVVFSDKAVWISGCEMDFYVSKRRHKFGNSLKKEKFSAHLDKDHPIKVKCFDFSKWVINNFTKEDYIILKMDIEGAEYDVLEKMIIDGSINYIDKAFIEFHFDRMKMDKERHFVLVDKLNKISGFELLPEFTGYTGQIGRL